MESTEHLLEERHLAGCLELSKSANWNQNEADWRLMLGFGRGWGVTLEDGTLAASTLVLPYGERFAWVAMVLVLPEQRRKGYASQLLRTALADLENRGLTPILDATPAGREVYRQEGFKDTWGFKRYSLSGNTSSRARAKQITASDWPRILELDRQAFGGNREVVLRNLAQRLPETALVSESGFVLGREGREAIQIGPLVAHDERSACELLAAALSRIKPPVYLDVLDAREGARLWLEGCGFVFQRPFTRMVCTSGEAIAPGDASLVFCPAGPELG
jgi:ribosomal protein S18 acetylase RimI-like enzyme